MLIEGRGGKPGEGGHLRRSGAAADCRSIWVDNAQAVRENHVVTESVEQVVRSFRKTSARVLREINTPAKARNFLIKAGILVKHSKSPNGVRLAKPYR